MVHVSWDGATEMASWDLYKTTKQGDARELVAFRWRDGFDTALTRDGYASYIVVEGIDNHGKSLGSSRGVNTIEPTNLLAPNVVAEAKWQEDHSNGHGSWPFDSPVVMFFWVITFCMAALTHASVSVDQL